MSDKIVGEYLTIKMDKPTTVKVHLLSELVPEPCDEDGTLPIRKLKAVQQWRTIKAVHTIQVLGPMVRFLAEGKRRSYPLRQVQEWIEEDDVPKAV